MVAAAAVVVAAVRQSELVAANETVEAGSAVAAIYDALAPVPVALCAHLLSWLPAGDSVGSAGARAGMEPPCVAVGHAVVSDRSVSGNAQRPRG